MLMHPDSIEKTAFSTPDGHNEFVRLPFGLKIAPSDFSRIMFIVLGDLIFVKIFFDDVVIHSKEFYEHLEHLNSVFKRLREAKLKIDAEKCTLHFS